MNIIELVTKYLPILDEQYKLDSRSAVLDTPAEFIRQTKDAKKFKVAKLYCDGLADYSRNSGFTTGAADLTWEEHEYTIDRGRALQIDAEDNEETFGLAFGRLAGEFQRQHVIPEMDAIRFSKYYNYAGTKKTLVLTADNILSVIDDLDAEMDDMEVPEEGRIIFCDPVHYKMICNDNNISKSLSVNDNLTKALNKKIYDYNNHPIIKVPSNRFYTNIQLLDGKTEGQEIGGYVKSANASIISLLMVQASAVIQTAKRAISRYWAPTRAEAEATRADGVNPYADAWRFDFRNYHDAWVLDNKVNAIAGVVDLGIANVLSGKYDGSTWTDGNKYYFKPTSTGKVGVVGVVPYETVDTSGQSLQAGNRFQVKFANPEITAKSQLPTGNIVKIYGTGNLTEANPGVKANTAFGDDGTLVLVVNADATKDIHVEITWKEGVVSKYIFNFDAARFEEAA